MKIKANFVKLVTPYAKSLWKDYLKRLNRFIKSIKKEVKK